MRRIVCSIVSIAFTITAAPLLAQDSWPFEPAKDTYAADAILDLRGLNETIAGEHGFIRKSDDGESFVRGDGEPIRFWGLTTYVFRKGMADTEDHARFLAKRGVNMVRWHGNLAPVDNPDSELSDINEKELDELFLLVAAMKKQGIYVTVSPYYPHATPTKENGKPKFRRWGITIGSNAENPTGLLFFHPEMQQAYKDWLRVLFTRVNPHTGVALKDEPAVALFQIQNEDSLLFWTFNSITGPDLNILREQFGKWLARRHGSLEKAKAAWDDAPPEGSSVADDWDKGLVSFPNVWHFTQPVDTKSPLGKRLADTLQFLTETMHDWNTEVGRYLRNDLGVKQLINAGNWTTANNAMLGDAERYSYTANDVIGVNRYMNGVHTGKHQGWAIVNGDRYTDLSTLKNPHKLPIALRQPAGHPIMVFESNWTPPNLYQSEGPFVVSVMQSLTGVDGFYWFSMGKPQFAQPASANGYLPSLQKWIVETPTILGNFPAAALMFRKAYVKEAEPVLVEHRTLDDLRARRLPRVTEGDTFDPNRHDRDASNVKYTGMPPSTFLRGPVKVQFYPEKSRTIGDKLSLRINDAAEVRTSTNEVIWDTALGLCMLKAPKAQGVTGFLSARPKHEMKDLTIESTNDYASILAVPLDDAPLASSKRVLIQIGTTARPTGFASRPITFKHDDATHAGFEITNYGKAPWRVTSNAATITIDNPHVRELLSLDMNGVVTKREPVRRAGPTATIELPAAGMYFVLE